MRWFTYILQCADGSYYVGHTSDVDARIAIHNAGKGAAYTRLRRPVDLVYSETHSRQTEAITREKQIKRWSRAKKRALIIGDQASLHDLAKRRN